MRKIMAKQLCTQFNFNIRNLQPKPTFYFFGTTRKLSTIEVPVKEIKISAKWGNIAAKLWGNGPRRPILAIHGWMDNAGTWDTLAPMLIRSCDRPILAIDCPGCGLSPWMPPGVQYCDWDLTLLILCLMDYFKWDKVSLLAHSLGSIASFRMASVFPNDVDFYIAFDNMIHQGNDSYQIQDYSKILKKMQGAWYTCMEEELKMGRSYSWEEIKKKFYLGRSKSVDLENIEHLMKRGCKQSKQLPNKYIFSHDLKLQHFIKKAEDKKFVEALALRLKCPTLFIKGKDSSHALDSHSVGIRKLIETNNENFEYQLLLGTHHIHLNNPDIVLPVIMNFLAKHNLL